jgi:hypothetical protein
VALIATQKKTHGASGIADGLLGFHARLPILRQAKLYLETHNRSKPEKGLLLNDHHAS